MLLRMWLFGGYFQWVLDGACETVEWPYQPLGFDSLALRSLLGLMNGTILPIYGKLVPVSQAAPNALDCTRTKAPD
jgi:hypothetical protein